MRKVILIAAISLLATQAFAGGPRGLSLATINSSQPSAAEPATVTPEVKQVPTAMLPANVQTSTTTPASAPPAAAQQPASAPLSTPVQSSVAPSASTSEATKPKRRRLSDEARLIRELHRHGIYW
jgi:hypothetical protein